MKDLNKIIEKQDEFLKYLLKHIGGYEASSIRIQRFKNEIYELKHQSLQSQPDDYKVNCSSKIDFSKDKIEIFFEGKKVDLNKYPFNQLFLNQSQPEPAGKLYRQVYIKDTSDLPDQYGFYFCSLKDDIIPCVTEYQAQHQQFNDKWWLKNVDWYLQPLPEEAKESNEMTDEAIEKKAEEYVKNIDFTSDNNLSEKGRITVRKWAKQDFIAACTWIRSQMNNK